MQKTHFPDYPSAMPTLPLSEEAELTPLMTSASGELLSLFDRDREHLREWCPWVDAYRSLESAHGMISTIRGEFEEQTALWLGIRRRGALVGITGLYGLCASQRHASFACLMEKAHEGRGLASRAAVALVRYGMDVLGLIRVELQIATGNRRVTATAEHLGFQYEGLLRCAQWLNGHPVDSAVYSITVRDKRMG